MLHKTGRTPVMQRITEHMRHIHESTLSKGVLNDKGAGTGPAPFCVNLLVLLLFLLLLHFVMLLYVKLLYIEAIYLFTPLLHLRVMHDLGQQLFHLPDDLVRLFMRLYREPGHLFAALLVVCRGYEQLLEHISCLIYIARAGL